MKTTYTSNIMAARAVEDCIRNSRKYTKMAFSKPVQHPVQGEFSSRLITEHYEVYPEMEMGWNMLAADAWAWMRGDTPKVDVWLKYDYRDNTARIIIGGGDKTADLLKEGIQGLADAMKHTARSNNGDRP